MNRLYKKSNCVWMNFLTMRKCAKYYLANGINFIGLENTAMFKLMHPFIFKLIVIMSLIFVLAVCSDGESEETVVDHTMLLNGVPQRIELGSSVFSDGGYLPGAHTCYGLDRSPPLFWGEVPDSTQSLALIVNEPNSEEQPGRANW